MTNPFHSARDYLIWASVALFFSPHKIVDFLFGGNFDTREGVTHVSKVAPSFPRSHSEVRVNENPLKCLKYKRYRNIFMFLHDLYNLPSMLN